MGQNSSSKDLNSSSPNYRDGNSSQAKHPLKMTPGNYRVRHLKRLKTDIGSKLNEGLTDEGRQVN